MSLKAWLRSVHSSTDWTTGFHLLAQLSPGDTLLRIHFGWGFSGVTPATGNLLGVMQNLQVFGLVTTVGDGGGPPPDPRLDPEDVLPPSQRWLHWETRAPRVCSADGTTGLVTWTNTEPQQPMDSKGMVSAKTVPDGQFLNLWASWAASYDWPADGSVQMWYWLSMLGEVAE